MTKPHSTVPLVRGDDDIDYLTRVLRLPTDAVSVTFNRVLRAKAPSETTTEDAAREADSSVLHVWCGLPHIVQDISDHLQKHSLTLTKTNPSAVVVHHPESGCEAKLHSAIYDTSAGSCPRYLVFTKCHYSATRNHLPHIVSRLAQGKAGPQHVILDAPWISPIPESTDVGHFRDRAGWCAPCALSTRTAHWTIRLPDQLDLW